MKQFLFVGIIGVLLSSCEVARYDKITYRSFPEVVALTGENLVRDSMIFAYPRMKVSGATCCIMEAGLDNHDLYFRLFTFPGFEYLRSTGKHGRGAGEILTSEFSLTSDDLYVLGHPSGIARYSLRGDAETYDDLFDTPEPLAYYDFVPVNDSLFAFYKSIAGKHAIQLANRKGEIVDSLLERPDVKDWPMPTRNVWDSFLAYNPSKNVLVTATIGGEVLDIIHLDTREHVIAVGPGGKPRPQQTGNLFASYTIKGFGPLFLGDKYIYALFSGMSSEDVMKLDAPIPYDLHVYDYEGRPVKKYTLDENLISFHVDESTNKLYATADAGEDPVFVYDL